MGEIKSGELNPKVILGLAPGLIYLKKTGTDVPILNITKRERVIYKKHDLFEGKNNILPRPYIDGDNIIPKDFIDVYGLSTKVDLARYVRIISIIISGFTGPVEADHLGNHVLRLKNMLEKEIGQSDKERAMRVCLLAYEQYTGKRASFHSLLKEKDYISFIRVLNSHYNLY